MSSESNRQQQRAQWHERIVAQSLSGLAMSEFCRQQGLCSKTFYRWKSRLNEVATGTVAETTKQPKFLLVNAPPRAAQRLVLMRLTSGAQISVFDVSAIPALLAGIG